VGAEAKCVPFVDRADAGRQLAARLEDLRGSDAVVLGLPRGGVPVASEVARRLGLPLDVILVRKLGVPFQPELGMGAIGEGGIRVVNADVVRMAGVSPSDIEAVEAGERQELDRRAVRYRGDRPPLRVAGRTAVVVDDGIATGSTARAACQVARAMRARRVILATPVAPPSTVADLATEADEVVSVETPSHFFAIGQFYGDFSQTTDDEVMDLLRQAGTRSAVEVEIAMEGVRLPAWWCAGDPDHGLVIFAHGSGSSSRSPRNRFVATRLNDAGLGTLLFDLLTPEEEADRTNVFAVELLAHRLMGATRWARGRTVGPPRLLGYFGASTGAAAALWAAAQAGTNVAAVVSRGGRPDLAGDRLPAVRAATLLIVGEADEQVLQLNQEAARRLGGPNELAIVPEATHLFEEPGALEQVADLATGWFQRYLQSTATSG
jgi:putative phosphoribosyl transferase